MSGKGMLLGPALKGEPGAINVCILGSFTPCPVDGLLVAILLVTAQNERRRSWMRTRLPL